MKVVEIGDFVGAVADVVVAAVAVPVVEPHTSSVVDVAAVVVVVVAAAAVVADVAFVADVDVVILL